MPMIMPVYPLKGKVITIDGPTASGKGTLAKRLAKRYRAKYLDTGSIYRALTWYTMELGKNPTNEADAVAAAAEMPFDFCEVGDTFAPFIDGKNVKDKLHTPEVDSMVGWVAPLPSVRQALLELQKHFVATWAPEFGVILDGRDTGARIAPQAEVKFFMQADPMVRAHRRAQEYIARGIPTDVYEVLAKLQERDANDAENIICCADAVVLDATSQSADQVEEKAMRIITKRLGIV